MLQSFANYKTVVVFLNFFFLVLCEFAHTDVSLIKKFHISQYIRLLDKLHMIISNCMKHFNYYVCPKLVSTYYVCPKLVSTLHFN